MAVIGDAFARDAGLEAACLSGIAMGEQISTLPDTLAAPRGRVASR